MKLEDGKTYRNGRGREETVGGTTQHYADWVWTIQGNWYVRATGRAVGYHQTAPRSRENPYGVWEHYVREESNDDLVEEVAS